MKGDAMKPETMQDFFSARIDEYDTHMLEEVVGCREGYLRMASALPDDLRYLLDLGAGTGLQLVPIFERFPHLCVSAIDLSGVMLARLRCRFPDKHICATVGDFTKMNLGKPIVFGAAVSFEVMHHLTAEERLAIYTTIFETLLPGGVYLEGDYTAKDEAEEAAMREEAERQTREHALLEGVRYHIDTPLTAEHTAALLTEAGFADVEVIYREGATVLLRAVAKK